MNTDEMGSNSEIFQRINNSIRERVSRGGDDGTTRSWRDPLQFFATVLLSLLLPLSFILLARLSAAHYLECVVNSPQIRSTTTGLLSLLFLNSSSTVLYVLVSLVSVAAFVDGLTTGRVTFLPITQSPEPIIRLPLYVAWALVFTIQGCLVLGIEGSISAGIDGSGFGRPSSLLTRALLLVGLHETTQFWSKSVVKPLVVDAVFGTTDTSSKEERWVERVGMALSFGALWWCRLRDEVDSLVVVAELMLAGHAHSLVGVADFVGWWLYYLTVFIGIMKAFKGVIWLGMILVLRKVEKDPCSVPSHPAVDDKV